jgi:hypothetical protein
MIGLRKIGKFEVDRKRFGDFVCVLYVERGYDFTRLLHFGVLKIAARCS